MALTKAMAMEPLIILDLCLPVITGIEVAKRLRSDPRMALTPIVAISASVMNREAETALSVACNVFFGKPINVEQLVDTVRALLGRITDARGLQTGQRAERLMLPKQLRPSECHGSYFVTVTYFPATHPRPSM